MQHHDVVEMSIADMGEALESGRLTSVDVVCASLNRIAYFDRTGLCLNAVPVLNPEGRRRTAITLDGPSYRRVTQGGGLNFAERFVERK